MAICAGFNETPRVCLEEEIKKRGGGIGFLTILMIIVLVIALNIAFIYLYRRHTKREMREEMQLQISSIMSQYLALNENKTTSQGANP
jgi:Kef-type K+ transport system membrane component KefB